jgi:Kef-type K+ transport system membrane component KefB
VWPSIAWAIAAIAVTFGGAAIAYRWARRDGSTNDDASLLAVLIGVCLLFAYLALSLGFLH